MSIEVYEEHCQDCGNVVEFEIEEEDIEQDNATYIIIKSNNDLIVMENLFLWMFSFLCSKKVFDTFTGSITLKSVHLPNEDVLEIL